MRGAAAVLLAALTFPSFGSGASAATRQKSVLFVLSGADHITGKDGKPHRTGYWLEEFSVPYLLLRQSGVRIAVATPKGNRPSADPASLSAGERAALKLKARVLDRGPILSLAKLDAETLAGFDAVFFPGGHAPMEDLAVDARVGKLLRAFHVQGKTTALVCHGPIALLSAAAGEDFPYRGYKVTAFSDSEEKGSEVGSHLRTTPEAALQKAGALFVKGPDWAPHVVEDRELITGQNPASSQAVAEAILRRLE